MNREDEPPRSASERLDIRWSSHYDQGREYRRIIPSELDKILSFVGEASKTALDIGCGTGHLARELYHRGYTVVGLDASTSAIDKARAAASDPSGRLTYVHADFERNDLPRLPRQPYGLITCKLVYAFIKEKPTFLERVRQLLVPGGSFVVVTPMPEDAPDKPAIAATAEDVDLLSSTFKEAALYKEHGMTHFVGRTS